MKKALLTAMIILMLSVSLVAGVHSIEVAKANFMPPYPDLAHIYITNNGSIEPTSAPIKKIGNTYTLTDNIRNYSLTVQCSNIILEGANFTLQGNQSNGIVAKGIDISHQNNITIKDFNIKMFEYGIMSYNNNINIIIRNNLTQNSDGIELIDSHGNIIVENNIIGNVVGIYSHSNDNTAANNTISKNNIASNEAGINLIEESTTIAQNNITNNNYYGIRIVAYQNNRITENQISHNAIGIYLDEHPKNNAVYLNNVLQNSENIYDHGPIPHFNPPSLNIWDNGTKGNYWSNYNGTDANGDGVGDTPFIIDGYNADNHPFVAPIDLSALLPKPVPIPARNPIVSPSPSPTPTLLPSITPNPSPFLSATIELTSPPTPSHSPTPTQQLTPTPTISPTHGLTFAPSPSPTQQPTSEPSQTAQPTTPPEKYASPMPYLILAGILIALVIVGLAVYFTKFRKKKT